MRLIDADALLDKQESLYMKGNVLFHGVTACAIENAPTIDPETLPLVQELQAQVKEQKEQLSHLEYWELDRKQVLKSAAGDRAAVNVMRKHCEKTIAELRAELKRVTAERDAAKQEVEALPIGRCKDCLNYFQMKCLKIYDDGNASVDAWQERKPDDFCSYFVSAPKKRMLFRLQKRRQPGKVLACRAGKANFRVLQRFRAKGERQWMKPEKK